MRSVNQSFFGKSGEEARWRGDVRVEREEGESVRR